MKLIFSQNVLDCYKSVFLLMLSFAFFTGCAVKAPRYGSEVQPPSSDKVENIEVEHTLYLIGDAGNSNENSGNQTLDLLKTKLKSADRNSTLLFLGDNIYPDGMPEKGFINRKSAENKLNHQLELAKGFLGKTIFVPGNHDWHNQGLIGLKNQENYVNNKLKGEKSFSPQNGCGIDNFSLSENVEMITIDSHWFLEEWDRNPNINEDCVIKSREEFFKELERLINQNQPKTIVIAIHHPLMTNGSHGGQFSLEKQLFPLEQKIPLPVIGSLINFLRKTSGVSPQDLQHKRYTELANRVKALVQPHKNIVLVSGHDLNLQYVEKNNVKQIISGSGSKVEAARIVNNKDFSAGTNGYAVLKIAKNGEAVVSYFGVQNNKEQLLFNQKILVKKEKDTFDFDQQIPKFQKASVYAEEKTVKKGFYKFLWGKHYRSVYGQEVKVRNVLLDTLFGGLIPVSLEGSNQSKFLWLEDSKGKQFVMKGLKKSATRLIQSLAFEEQSIENDFKNTFTEDFLLDFYTSSHPYTPFAVSSLAKAVGINHTNPQLFYVPKQKALGEFNANYGNELYLIEEHPMDKFKSYSSFGRPIAIVHTDTVLANIVADEKYEVDEVAYVRARLFDMLIGDWNRHADQWRWGEFREKGKIIYRPIPRNRDQAFPKYGGLALTLILTTPDLRHIRSFKPDIGNIKWFNQQSYALDLKLLKTADAKMWNDQADFIKNNLTNEEIDKAFKLLPTEVQDQNLEEIKRILRLRKGKLDEFATRYFKVLQRTVLMVGTNERDKFVIYRQPQGKTEVHVYRLIKGREELQYVRVFDKKETKQIWIYGLEQEDVFVVKGKERKSIRVKIIGGNDNDSYTIESGKKVAVFDYESKPNVFEIDDKTSKILSDSYEMNTYDYKKPKFNAFAGIPNIGFNPDDGVKIGISTTFKVNSFIRNPFSQRHNLRANYYFATQGYEFKYNGIFPNSINNWRVEIDAIVTGPNFSSNFFGFGNETQNSQKDLGLDYNRVKIQTIGFAPSLNWQGVGGAFFSGTLNLRSMQVDRTSGRFIADNLAANDPVFDTQNYVALQARYGFENYDNTAHPTMGVKFYIEAGYELSLKSPNKRVPHAETAFGFSHRITKSDKLVFGSLAKMRMLFSDEYVFYQMAELGGNADLRAYRFQRFLGKQSFFVSSDLRYKFGKLKNDLVPVTYGLLAGFDTGRVWLKNDASTKWHNSFGVGLWLNGIDIVTAKASYFQGGDGGRVSVGLGFEF